MQPLARDGLTDKQVTDLLQSSNLTVDYGAELLKPDLSFSEDISADLLGGSVARNCFATIHGTVDLTLSRRLRWGVDLVKPYMILSDGDIEARWDQGVFMLTTPERNVGETPETYDAQGYDRLHLLQRQIGEHYAALAGNTYRQALLDVFADAGLTGVLIDGSAADDTLPKDKLWPLVARDQSDPEQINEPVTWLRVVNDLLRAINFRSVWCDEAGIYRCGAYQEPIERGSEFTLSSDVNLTIVGENRRLSADVWATPNRWVFRQTNRPEGAPTATEGDGIYTIDESDDVSGDWLGRLLTWTSVIDYEAASQAKLVELGERRKASDKRTTEMLSFTTGPFPGAGHFDVMTLEDDVLGTRKIMGRSWRMPLDGGDVEWEAEVIV